MKTPPIGLVAMSVCALALTAPCGAGFIAFEVSIDTSNLTSHEAEGPFHLDFQFTDFEGGSGNNTAVVDDFVFFGGGWVGEDPGEIVFPGDAFFDEFVQEFMPGDLLAFDVLVTNNPNPGEFPDQLSLAILGGDLVEIPTLGPGNALLTIDLGVGDVSVHSFPTDPLRTSITIPAPIVEQVPGPGATLPIALGAIGALGRRRRRRRGGVPRAGC